MFRWLPIMTSWRKVLVRWLPIMTSWRKDKQSCMLRYVSMHTFLTMIIEESVCFMSCEPILLLQLFLCSTHGIYFYFFSSTEHCAWAIISPKEFKFWVTRMPLHYCTGQQNYLLSNILRFTLKICFWVDFQCYAVDFS